MTDLDPPTAAGNAPDAPASPSDEPSENTAPSPDGGAQAEAPPAAPEPTGDPMFDALWTKVLATWDDDKVHGAILEYSVTAERLPDLAGRYRALKEDPAKAERAKKRLDAIILAATSLMMSMRTPANTKVPLSITMSVAGIFACAVAFVAYAMLHR